MSLPQINTELTRETYSYRQPDLTYRLGEKTVNGKLDKLESVKQSVYHILMTERYSNPIYSDDYGVELEQYISKDIGYITAGIQATLNDALTQDDRITGVYVNDVSKSDTQQNACTISFTIDTIYGSYEDKLTVNQ